MQQQQQRDRRRSFNQGGNEQVEVPLPSFDDPIWMNARSPVGRPTADYQTLFHQKQAMALPSGVPGRIPTLVRQASGVMSCDVAHRARRPCPNSEACLGSDFHVLARERPAAVANKGRWAPEARRDNAT